MASGALFHRPLTSLGKALSDGIILVLVLLQKNIYMSNKFILIASLFLVTLACNKTDMVKVNQESYPLPDPMFFPEGIAYNPKTGIFYTGSTMNGDIVQVNVQNGQTSLFASGAKQGRTFATGMKLDAKGRLWVCGGAGNMIFLLDKDGSLIKSWDMKAMFNSGFINDCILDNKYVYFTDSQMRKVYRTTMPTGRPGEMEEFVAFTDQQVPPGGTNANGIELTPDGKFLIVVISNAGKLFRINTSNKNVTEILLNTPVTSGDGLWLEGNTLYVSRNATGQIFPVVLNSDYTQGTVGVGFGSNLLFNTTIAKAGNYFLVVNGQLNRRPNPANPNNPPPVLPFTISRVAIP